MSDESESPTRPHHSSLHFQRWGGIHMKRVLIDPAIRHGHPVVLGTRVTATEIVASLAGGMSFKEIEREYDVTPRDIRASLGFLAQVAFFYFDERPLDDSDPKKLAEIERAWIVETKRRLAKLKSGETQGIPAEEAFAEVQAFIKREQLKRLRRLVQEGCDSPSTKPVDADYFKRLRRRIRAVAKRGVGRKK